MSEPAGEVPLSEEEREIEEAREEWERRFRAIQEVRAWFESQPLDETPTPSGKGDDE